MQQACYTGLAKRGQREMETKVCSKCKKEKPVDEYTLRKVGDYVGPNSFCKKCGAQRMRKVRDTGLKYQSYKANKRAERCRHYIDEIHEECKCLTELPLNFNTKNLLNQGITKRLDRARKMLDLPPEDRSLFELIKDIQSNLEDVSQNPNRALIESNLEATLKKLQKHRSYRA